MKTLALIVAAAACLAASIVLGGWTVDQRYSESGKLLFTLDEGRQAELHSTEAVNARFSSCDPFRVYFHDYGFSDGAFTQVNGSCPQKGQFVAVIEMKDATFKIDDGRAVTVTIETPGLVWVKTTTDNWMKVLYSFGMGALILTALYLGWKAFTRIRDRVSH